SAPRKQLLDPLLVLVRTAVAGLPRRSGTSLGGAHATEPLRGAASKEPTLPGFAPGCQVSQPLSRHSHNSRARRPSHAFENRTCSCSGEERTGGSPTPPGLPRTVVRRYHDRIQARAGETHRRRTISEFSPTAIAWLYNGFAH